MFSTVESELWKNAGLIAFQLQKTTLKSDIIIMTWMSFA